MANGSNVERYSIPSAADIRVAELREKDEIEQDLLVLGLRAECARWRTKRTPGEGNDQSALADKVTDFSSNESPSDEPNVQKLLNLMLAEQRKVREAITEMKADASHKALKPPTSIMRKATDASDANTVAATDATPAGSQRSEARARAHLPGAALMEEDDVDTLVDRMEAI
jgi:hypothetical protein